MKKTFILVLFAGWTGICYSQSADVEIDTTDVAQDPFTFEASYVGDFFSNMHGGKRQGSGYLGMLNVMAGFDTQKARWWKGGELFLHGASTHGATPTATFIGDLQTASNIEAGDHLYVQELWFSQTLGQTQWVVGAQDLNVEFLVSESGSMFLNSSFGIPALVSYNMPVPIFPLTTVGITGRWFITDDFYTKLAVYDGEPNSFDNNQHNLGWHFNNDEGMLMISETGISTNICKLGGSYKLGVIYHSGLKAVDETTGQKTTVYNYNYGIYGLCDQKIWQSQSSQRYLTLFLQGSVSPLEHNSIPYYVGGGCCLNGLFKSSGDDVLGLAFAHADLHNMIEKHETAIELSYQLPLGRHFFVQPDFQYIINPAGTDVQLDDAMVAFCRVGINF
jgi:porin